MSDIAKNQNKLDMQENTRVYHFIEGLKPELHLNGRPQSETETSPLNWLNRQGIALIDADVLDISNITVTVVTNQENTTGLPIIVKNSIR